MKFRALWPEPSQHSLQRMTTAERIAQKKWKSKGTKEAPVYPSRPNKRVGEKKKEKIRSKIKE